MSGNETRALDDYLFRRDARASRDPGELLEASPTTRELLRIPARDGHELSATVFRAADPDALARASERPAVVVASATGVRQGFYASFAAHLAARGHDVLTFDYRGIGESSGAPSVTATATMSEWGTLDLAAVVARAGRELGRGAGTTSVVGHSVGGQLIGLLPDPSSSLHRVVMVASQSGDFRLWPLPSRLAMAAFWYGIVPGVTRAVGYLPGSLGIGEDLPPGVALEWAAWCRTPGYLVGADEDARAGFAAVRAPVLAFAFDDDPYAPPAAVDALLSLYESAPVERRDAHRAEFGPLGHFGFFRVHRGTSSPVAPRLWEDAAQFLER